jgi:hypothetical protein
MSYAVFFQWIPAFSAGHSRPIKSPKRILCLTVCCYRAKLWVESMAGYCQFLMLLEFHSFINMPGLASSPAYSRIRFIQDYPDCLKALELSNPYPTSPAAPLRIKRTLSTGIWLSLGDIVWRPVPIPIQSPTKFPKGPPRLESQRYRWAEDCLRMRTCVVEYRSDAHHPND